MGGAADFFEKPTSRPLGGSGPPWSSTFAPRRASCLIGMMESGSMGSLAGRSLAVVALAIMIANRAIPDQVFGEMGAIGRKSNGM
jgi:hypothetical protein